jgi:hypothetical protein
MQSPFCRSLNHTLHNLPCPIIISCRNRILMIGSHLNLRKNFAFQYNYISLLLLYILCPCDSQLGSAKWPILFSSFSNFFYCVVTTWFIVELKIFCLAPNRRSDKRLWTIQPNRESDDRVLNSCLELRSGCAEWGLQGLVRILYYFLTNHRITQAIHPYITSIYTIVISMFSWDHLLHSKLPPCNYWVLLQRSK